MARAESKMVMGYLPIEERHYPALFHCYRLLDLFAKDGAFHEAAAKAGCSWSMARRADYRPVHLLEISAANIPMLQ